MICLEHTPRCSIHTKIKTSHIGCANLRDSGFSGESLGRERNRSRSSAERPACHCSLCRAAPPVIEHTSNAERPTSSEPSSVCHGSLIDKLLLAPEPLAASVTTLPSPPPLRLKPATALYDQFLADLEEGRRVEDVFCLLGHIERFCFFGDLCFVNASGDNLEQPSPLSLKTEYLLHVVLAQRREIAAAAGLGDKKLAHHQATPSQMKDMINAWRKNVSSWMSTRKP